MSLSELYRMARGSLESSQQKPTSTFNDLSHIPGNDEFVELVWENGQIMMQGQSSRAKRNTNPNNSQSQIPRFQDRDFGNTTNPKMARYGLMDSVLDDFTATVPSSDLGLDQDEEMTPWLNYNDPLHTNSFSDFLPELSSVTINDLPNQSNMASIDKKGIFNSTFNGNQPLAPSHAQASSSGFANTSSGIINFSHFSRPVSLARADTRNVSIVAPASSSGVDKTVVPINNAIGSNIQPNLLSQKVNTQNCENHGNVFLKDAVRKDIPRHQVDGAVANKVSGEGENAVEPVVASLSVCSGNNPEQTSDDQNHDLKRKSRETDDSEGRSEDLEEESVGVRKAAPARGGTGTKRSRAAEVHNLSERRRRDRINEKMRALQELIPNCNKVDKASMLDEAIEYLKTLQLQVQIMAMGAGMYMPHMMIPAGLQHVPGHMAHFSPMMGVGMGMGMGFGMGMMDMNPGARFHGARTFPFSGPANFQMMSGPNGPGYPVSASCHPSVPIPANNVFGPRLEIPSSAPLPSEVTNNGFGHSHLPSKNDRVPNQVSLAKEVKDAPPS